MAIINKTGITTGGTIDAEHITRAIDALSGQSAASIVATGSLMGTASFAVTASYAFAMPLVPNTVPASPSTGSMYVDVSNPGVFWIYDGNEWYYYTGTAGSMP
jgi:hypothetical protein